MYIAHNENQQQRHSTINIWKFLTC